MILDYVYRLFNTDSLSPHGICLLWEPSLIWTHVISDFVIGLAYLSIPLVIISYVRAKPKMKYRWAAWAFATFIISCAFTHFMGIWTLWNPDYGVEALVKVGSAAASVGTAIALWPLLPKIKAIRGVDEFQVLLAERDAALAALTKHRQSLLEDREVITRELNHRVRNNLAIIEAAIKLQIQNLRNPVCTDILQDSLGRIRAISRVHGKLLAGTDLEVGVAAVNTASYVADLCNDLAQHLGARISLDVDPVEVPLDEAVPIAMLVNELVTNAAKHGKREGEKAQIRVTFKEIDERRWELCVSDKGPGLPDNILATKGNSLGVKLIKSLSSQLGGEMQVESNDQGATFRLMGVHHQTGLI